MRLIRVVWQDGSDAIFGVSEDWFFPKLRDEEWLNVHSAGASVRVRLADVRWMSVFEEPVEEQTARI